MGNSASAPPPPDTSKYSDAVSGDADVMRGWAQSVWDSSQEEMGRVGEYAQSFMGMTLPIAEEMFSWAKDQRQRYEENVLPAIQSLFSEAETYASKGEEDRQRGAAIQDVKAATEAQRESQLRKLESYGVDPSMTRYQSLDKQAGVAEAALSALAANQAGERTKQIGRDMRMDAINVGTGFLNDANASAMAATNIGATGANVGNAAAQTGTMLQQGALPFMAGANTGTATAAGIVDTGYSAELAYAADQREAEGGMSGIGGLIGGIAGNTILPGLGGAIGKKLGGMLGGAEGGAEGGPIQAPGGPVADGGVLKVSNGEYLVPADVVRKLGTKYFDKMIEKETGRVPPGQKTALPTGATA